jgi:hypothetical protein
VVRQSRPGGATCRSGRSRRVAAWRWYGSRGNARRGTAWRSKFRLRWATPGSVVLVAAVQSSPGMFRPIQSWFVEAVEALLRPFRQGAPRRGAARQSRFRASVLGPARRRQVSGVVWQSRHVVAGQGYAWRGRAAMVRFVSGKPWFVPVRSGQAARGSLGEARPVRFRSVQVRCVKAVTARHRPAPLGQVLFVRVFHRSARQSGCGSAKTRLGSFSRGSLARGSQGIAGQRWFRKRTARYRSPGWVRHDAARLVKARRGPAALVGLGSARHRHAWCRSA